MKKFFVFLLVVTGAFSMFRCSNEVDLYADYKDITIVYGLLDISDDTIWIKVTKAFLGPGNALVIAQNPDSSNYPNILPVTLTGKKNGVDQTPIILDTTTIHNKKAGDSVFYYPNQLMYYSTASIDRDAVYTLKINNGDKTIVSETPVISDFEITNPKNRISFTSANSDVAWKSAKNGKRYEVELIFNYKEWAPGYADTLYLQMYWFLGVELSKNTDGSESLIMPYSGPAFYERLLAALPVIDNVKRWAGPVNVVISAATQELHIYIESNGANGNLLQEVPLYSNIQNGIGMFGSRHTVNRPFELTVQSENALYGLGLGFLPPSK